MSLCNEKDQLVAVPEDVELGHTAAGERQAIFLSNLMAATAQSKQYRAYGYWVPMHSSVQRAILGRRYSDHLRQLIDRGIIERNDSYWAGDPTYGSRPFTKAVRFTERYRTGRFRLFQLTRVASKRAATKVRNVDPQNLEASGMHLWQNLQRFGLANPEKVTGDTWTYYTVARWTRGDHHATRCQYRRFHSLLTQSPRSLRQHITIDGSSETAIVDVSACQPLLIGNLAAAAQQQAATGDKRGKGAGPTNVMLRTFEKSASVPSDIWDWWHLCETGRIYDHMLDRIRRWPEPAFQWLTLKSGRSVQIDLRDATRDAIKRSTLVSAFDRQERTERNPLFRIVCEDFPSIAAFVRKAKSEGHEALARRLQEFESRLIIDGAIDSIRRTHPAEPVSTIHDAIFCRASFAPTAANAIRDQFAQWGMHPKVKAETFGQSKPTAAATSRTAASSLSPAGKTNS